MCPNMQLFRRAQRLDAKLKPLYFEDIFMIKTLKSEWYKFQKQWKKLSDGEKILITFMVMMEAGLFERFFYSPEVKENYRGILSPFNIIIHVIIFYPLLTYFFNRRK